MTHFNIVALIGLVFSGCIPARPHGPNVAHDLGVRADLGSADGGTPAMTDAAVAGGVDAGPRQSGEFPPSAVFYQDISGAALDAESKAMIDSLKNSGWNFRIDVSFSVLHAETSVAPRVFQATSNQRACDKAAVPVPAGGSIEGRDNYECVGADCHLIVYQGDRLYEMYQASISGGAAIGGDFTANCLVVWDLTRDYWAHPEMVGHDFGRGDGCNGADAADLPMAPLILKPEEVKAGEVKHALRFVLGNDHIRKRFYVHPATHLGGPSGADDAPPYGARFRLRADYDLSKLPNDAARTVARALQRYGMFIADGGGTFISATRDITKAIGPRDLTMLDSSDFEVVDGGKRIPYDEQHCAHDPVSY